MTGLGRLRPAALAFCVPLLLAACGGDDPPVRSKDIKPGPTCKTEGTIEAQPVPGLRAAVEPYLEPGHKVRIAAKFGSTAEVELRAGASGPTPATVTLVETKEGWVVTSVVRC